MAAETRKSRMPTNKWFVTQVTALSAWLVALIENGWEFTSSLQIVLVGIVAQAIIGYIIPNDQAPGGVARVQR